MYQDSMFGVHHGWTQFAIYQNQQTNIHKLLKAQSYMCIYGSPLELLWGLKKVKKIWVKCLVQSNIRIFLSNYY